MKTDPRMKLIVWGGHKLFGMYLAPLARFANWTEELPVSARFALAQWRAREDPYSANVLSRLLKQVVDEDCVAVADRFLWGDSPVHPVRARGIALLQQPAQRSTRKLARARQDLARAWEPWVRGIFPIDLSNLGLEIVVKPRDDLVEGSDDGARAPEQGGPAEEGGMPPTQRLRS